MRTTSLTLLLGVLLLVAQTTGATTYYAAPNGSGSCKTTQGSPGSFAASTGCLKPGDRLELAAGTYTDRPTSWAGGTSDAARVTIAGVSAATVIIRAGPPSGQGAMLYINVSYITFENLTLDGINYSKDNSHDLMKITDGASHVRLSHVVLMNSVGINPPTGAAAGILIGPPGYNEFLNMEAKNNRGYAFYMASPNNLVDHLNCHDNGRYCLHVYSDSGGVNNNIIRNSRIWNNGHNSYGCWGGCTNDGMVLSSGSGHLVYNNLIYNSGAGGIQVDADNVKLYNNTIVSNNGDCIHGNGSATSQNNICWQNHGNITVGGTADHNLFSDPKFVGANAGDFHLQSGSPAIKAGVDLSNVFTDDFAGMTRPPGPFDLGVLAVGGTGGGGGGDGVASLPAPRNLRLVTTPVGPQSSATPPKAP